MADERQLEYEDEQTADRSAQQPAVERANAGGSDLPIKQGAVFGAIALIATYLSHLFLTAIATARSTPAAGMCGGAFAVSVGNSFIGVDLGAVTSSNRRW